MVNWVHEPNAVRRFHARHRRAHMYLDLYIMYVCNRIHMEPLTVCRMVCTTVHSTTTRLNVGRRRSKDLLFVPRRHASISPIQAGTSHFSYYATATLWLRLESLSSSMVMSRESSHYVVTCHPPGAVLKTVKCHFLSKDSQVSVVASSRQVSLFVSWLVGWLVAASYLLWADFSHFSL